MTKWYDRIGNTIEMNIDNQWIKETNYSENRGELWTHNYAKQNY